MRVSAYVYVLDLPNMCVGKTPSNGRRSEVECRGNRVRLGIAAPKEVDIFRGGLADWREQWQDLPADAEAELELAFA